MKSCTKPLSLGITSEICFFKQKPAYELEARDWSLDVCSSDLGEREREKERERERETESLKSRLKSYLFSRAFGMKFIFPCQIKGADL